MTKILHANDDNYNLGGAFIISYRVEEYLRRYGYSYDYLTMDRFSLESDSYPIPKDDKVYSANLRNNKFFGHILLPLYVLKVLKENNYSIIHIDTDSAWKALLYAIPAKIKKVKIIVHSHSTGIDGNFRVLKGFCEKFSKYLLLMFCDEYLACSQDAARWILPVKNKRTVNIIPNGIDLSKFYFDLNERKNIREKYSFGNSIVIGNVGLFSENKNQKFLINLLEQLIEKGLDVRLLLVGNNETEYGRDVMKLVNDKSLTDRVVFTGVSNDIRQLMNAMDIYIQPSYFEGFGLVSLEAQATGLQTYISSNLPCETLATKWASKISFNLDINDWINLVLSIKINNNERLERKIDSKFGIECMACKIADIYDKLLQIK